VKTFRNVLVNALMRPLTIEIVGISGDDAMQLMLMENEEVIGTLTLKRTHKSFAQGIGSRGLGWRFDRFDARAVETCPGASAGWCRMINESSKNGLQLG
jgi:hypothetical protein